MSAYSCDGWYDVYWVGKSWVHAIAGQTSSILPMWQSSGCIVLQKCMVLQRCMCVQLQHIEYQTKGMHKATATR